MRIAIIGAGVGGLTAAHDLRKAGHEVTVFEKNNFPGGLAAGFRQDNWNWSLEKYYHHWFKTDRHIIDLISELGFSSHLRFIQPKTVVYFQENFYPLDTPIAALKFPGFSFFNKIRFGLITAYLKYLAAWQPLEKYTAESWLRRWYGKQVYQVFFEPMLIGKFSGHYHNVNMAWLWARFKARTSQLGTFEGGFQNFLNLFAEKLTCDGVHFSYTTSIKKITAVASGQLMVETSLGKQYFDQVLATTAPKALEKMVPQLPAKYRKQINSLNSIGAIVVVFSIKHRLSTDGYYWFNLPKSAGFPFLALVEHTNYADSSDFGGEHIIYCGDYLDRDHEYFQMEDEILAGNFAPSLKRINPDFTEEWINNIWVFKTPYAQPIPTINHSQSF